ncbi:sensor histidine kinase [Thalassotalea ganghwensis]
MFLWRNTKRKSLVNRLYVSVCLLVVIAFLGLVAITSRVSGIEAFFIAALFGLFCCLILAVIFKQAMSPLNNALIALDNGIASLKDNDFSLTIHNENYQEIARLVSTYNELANVLRTERMDIFQRELLLDTVIQSTPVAIVLTSLKGHIVYSNIAAKHLLKFKGTLVGNNFFDLYHQLSESLQRATDEKLNGLVTDEHNDQRIVYSVNCQSFMLNGRTHQLYMYKNMTQEISQKETQMWKQVIRLISHELNNSLAPINSLTKSAQQIIDQPEHHHMLRDVLSTIGRRSQHLNEFIGQYASFAKMPEPTIARVSLQEFFNNMQTILGIDCSLDSITESAHFDAAQLEQVLINLVKNAKESGSDVKHVSLAIFQQANRLYFVVKDRGPGLSEQQMQQALLPFFTTKAEGSGIGLALCNEIVSLHGGQLKLANRDNGGLEVSFALPLADNH